MAKQINAKSNEAPFFCHRTLGRRGETAPPTDPISHRHSNDGTTPTTSTIVRWRHQTPSSHKRIRK